MGINERVLSCDKHYLLYYTLGVCHDSFSFVFCCFYILWYWAIQFEGWGHNFQYYYSILLYEHAYISGFTALLTSQLKFTKYQHKKSALLWAK